MSGRCVEMKLRCVEVKFPHGENLRRCGERLGRCGNTKFRCRDAKFRCVKLPSPCVNGKLPRVKSVSRCVKRKLRRGDKKLRCVNCWRPRRRSIGRCRRSRASCMPDVSWCAKLNLQRPYQVWRWLREVLFNLKLNGADGGKAEPYVHKLRLFPSPCAIARGEGQGEGFNLRHLTPALSPALRRRGRSNGHFSPVVYQRHDPAGIMFSVAEIFSTGKGRACIWRP